MKKFAALIMLFAMLLSGCTLSDRILAKKMIEKYSVDQNYVVLSGEITELDGNIVIIKCEELSKYLPYQGDLCDYYIYSDPMMELSVGDEIEFVTVPFHFYNGHHLPIVEVRKDDNILLAFEEGKANLIDWVNANFNQ